MATWPSPPSSKAAGDAVPSADWNKLIQGLIHLKERVDGLTPFTNSDAGALAAGDLLVQDAAAGERKFKKSAASAGAAGPFFVCLGTVAIAGTGYAAHLGFVDLQYTGTAPVAGDQLQSSATAGRAMVGTTNPLAVAYADGLSGSVQAILYGPGGSAGGGGGGGGSGGGLFDLYPTLVPPVLSSLTKINESVSKPFVQQGDNVRIWSGQIDTFPLLRIVAHTPANTHWHFRALVVLDSPRSAIGVCALNIADGNKSVVLRLAPTNGDAWRSSLDVFTSATTYGSGISSAIGAVPMNPVWLHALWDGTNMQFGYSALGSDTDVALLYSTTPTAAATHGWTSGHAPDAYGIEIEGLASLYNQSHLILSWEELALP